MGKNGNTPVELRQNCMGPGERVKPFRLSCSMMISLLAEIYAHTSFDALKFKLF